jgi:hypothetical protein
MILANQFKNTWLVIFKCFFFFFFLCKNLYVYNPVSALMNRVLEISWPTVPQPWRGAQRSKQKRFARGGNTSTSGDISRPASVDVGRYTHLVRASRPLIDGYAARHYWNARRPQIYKANGTPRKLAVTPFTRHRLGRMCTIDVWTVFRDHTRADIRP